jgi:hypothetical protein
MFFVYVKDMNGITGNVEFMFQSRRSVTIHWPISALKLQYLPSSRIMFFATQLIKKKFFGKQQENLFTDAKDVI